MNLASRPNHHTVMIAIALALAAGCAKSDDGSGAADARPINASADVDDAQMSNSDHAINVLLAVEQARGAVQRQDKEGAMTHVNAAVASLDPISKTALVPIYAELSQKSFIVPIAEAKGQPAKAASTDDSISKTATMDTLQPAPLAVRSVTSNYSRVLLDTSVAAKQLDAAKTALGNGDLKAADQHLATLERSVVLETATARMPLVKARENLTLASTAVRRSDWKNARVQLSAAARSLSDYAKTAPPADLSDVRVLKQQIAAYAGTVESQHGDAAMRVNDWWRRVANLTDKG